MGKGCFIGDGGREADEAAAGEDVRLADGPVQEPVIAKTIVPPVLASEIASLLHATTPNASRLFATDELSLSGRDVEQLMMAAFLVGYSQGLVDMLARTEGKPDSVFLAWAEENLPR